MSFIVDGTKDIYERTNAAIPKVFIEVEGKPGLYCFMVNEFMRSGDNKDLLQYALGHLLLMNKNIASVTKAFEATSSRIDKLDGETDVEAQQRLDKAMAEAGSIARLASAYKQDIIFIETNRRSGESKTSILEIGGEDDSRTITDEIYQNQFKSEGRLNKEFSLAESYKEVIDKMRAQVPNFNQAELVKVYESQGTVRHVRSYEIAKEMNKLIKKNKAQRVYH